MAETNTTDTLKELLDPKRLEIEAGEALIRKTIKEGAEQTLQQRGMDAMIKMVNQGKQNIDKPTSQVEETGKNVPAWSPLGLGGMNAQGNVEAPGAAAKLFSLLRTGSLMAGSLKGMNQSPTPETQISTLQKTKDLMAKMGIEGSYGVTATGAPTISTYTDMGNNTKLVYRNPVTGEVVPADIALQDMAEGKGVYQVNQQIKTRSGLQEKPVIKTNDLSTEEKTYLVAAQRIGTTLDNVLNDFDTIYSQKDPKLAKQFMVEKVPFWMIPDKDVQQVKANINRLKADIPFLRGGKQLTATEAKRVDTMLNPFGKNRDVYQEDIERFKKEFISGSNIMKYGLGSGLMKKEEKDLSSLSDDELKAIIGGK